jgi:hypothetical protein
MQQTKTKKRQHEDLPRMRKPTLPGNLRQPEEQDRLARPSTSTQMMSIFGTGYDTTG